MRRLLLVALAPVVIGAIVAVVWVNVVDPWYWQARGGRLVMTEVQADGQFRAVAWFIALGAVASAVWAAVVTTFGRVTWLLVPMMIVSSLAAALVAWKLGVMLGPTDPTSADGLAEGAKVAAALTVDSVAAFLAWPTAAVFGVFAATVFVGSRDTYEGTHAGSEPSL